VRVAAVSDTGCVRANDDRRSKDRSTGKRAAPLASVRARRRRTLTASRFSCIAAC
jgi:hypothetical protein